MLRYARTFVRSHSLSLAHFISLSYFICFVGSDFSFNVMDLTDLNVSFSSVKKINL